MRLLDHTYSTPAHNLACDELLLETLEERTSQPTLRFWESPIPFIVLGYANHFATEVNIAECTRLNIPILRRSSGGGTVVQGPGCLNYNLTLPIANETVTITDTNCYIMSKHRDAFTKLLGRAVQIQGHTDLTLIPGRTGASPVPLAASASEYLKFSGNAQRRKKNALVFHGCFLLNFDLTLITRLLAHPSKEPSYRARRPHTEFLTNLQIPTSTVKQALIETWSAHEPASPPNPAHLERLVQERYANPAWNQKF